MYVFEIEFIDLYIFILKNLVLYCKFVGINILNYECNIKLFYVCKSFDLMGGVNVGFLIKRLIL